MTPSMVHKGDWIRGLDNGGQGHVNDPSVVQFGDWIREFKDMWMTPSMVYMGDWIREVNDM